MHPSVSPVRYNARNAMFSCSCCAAFSASATSPARSPTHEYSSSEKERSFASSAHRSAIAMLAWRMHTSARRRQRCGL